jgi:hypothetical protein
MEPDAALVILICGRIKNVMSASMAASPESFPSLRWNVIVDFLQVAIWLPKPMRLPFLMHLLAPDPLHPLVGSDIAEDERYLQPLPGLIKCLHEECSI